MQLAGVWRVPLTAKTGLTLAGGPAGEPAIGPVAFMHRASAAENPFAPLSHHTFDSTHVSFGVVTAAVDHGPVTLEASVFNGREPDQHRWDFDFGALDSFAARVWVKPSAKWDFQVSSARLKDPEELEPEEVTRTTASATWFAPHGRDFSSVTAGFGLNSVNGESRRAFFAEGTHHQGLNSLFGRLEVVEVETSVLATGLTLAQLPAASTVPVYCPSTASHCTNIDAGQKDRVTALSLGGVRDVLRWRGFEGGVGAAVTMYGVPNLLKPAHGDHPVSFQLFFRLRPPTGSMGPMFNMRMTQPVKSMAPAEMDHHHQMD
jgi:hypothetical protein